MTGCAFVADRRRRSPCLTRTADSTRASCLSSSSDRLRTTCQRRGEFPESLAIEVSTRDSCRWRLIGSTDRRRQDRAEKRAKAEQAERPADEAEGNPFNQLLHIFDDNNDNELSADDAAESSEEEQTHGDPDPEKADEEPEAESDDGDDGQDAPDENSPFRKHFATDYEEKSFEALVQAKSVPLTGVYPGLGKYRLINRSSHLSDFDPSSRIIKKMWLKKMLESHASASLASDVTDSSQKQLRLQFLSIISQYTDILHLRRKLGDAQSFRWSYCLHILNHMLNVRQQILKNNAKITKARAEKQEIDDLETRDQGFTRARVLILLPFRESVKSVVETFARLLFGPEHDGQTIQMKRFLSEFSSRKELRDPLNKKPADFMETFAGNTDDSFRIGLAVTKKSLKLFTDFYDSDIVICSPLALRMMITGDQPDYDFLSSVEILVLDQTEVFIMQNWEHVIEIVKHLNQKPVNSHGIDFSRVKMQFLDEKGSHFRQNIFLGSAFFNEAVALFNKSARNIGGQVTFANEVPVEEAAISRVFVNHCQNFTRHHCSSLDSCSDARFEFFTRHVLPGIRNDPHVMIYVSSYFDFVRLRNFMKQEEYNFVSLCEYTDEGKVAQGRSQFFKEGRRLLLYTERLHFYRRFQIKGVRKVWFYQLPSLPQFYNQICNLMIPALQGKRFTDADEKKMSITTVYCAYDAHRLKAILGSANAYKLLQKKGNDGENMIFYSE